MQSDLDLHDLYLYSLEFTTSLQDGVDKLYTSRSSLGTVLTDTFQFYCIFMIF